MRHCILVALAVLVAGCSGAPLHKGKPASYWREALTGDDAELRREAITAMGALKLKDAVPELIAALKDKDAKVRAKAAESLWSVGGADTTEAIPALVPLLKDKDANVRLNTAGALGQIGPEAKAAIPALRETLKDSDVYVRAQAATALGL